MNEFLNFLIRLVLFNSLILIGFIFVQNESKKDPFSTQNSKFSFNLVEMFTSVFFSFQIFASLFLLKIE